MSKVPARLHVIPAGNCSKALIFRRGPSGQVASILWDRATDTFDMGQWLKGRIYEHRSDLSPDGRHMVYFAGKSGSYWTALSRAPYLRALVFLPQSSTWGGGGAFDSIGRVWLGGDTAPGGALPDGLRQAPDMAFPGSTDGFHLGDTYTTVLARRGWTHKSGTGYSAVLRRELHAGWALELKFAISAKNRSIISNRYALVQTGRYQRIEKPEWEWAEPFGDQLCFAAGGALQRAWIGLDGELLDKTLIRDFNEMAFESLEAPYEGVNDQ